MDLPLGILLAAGVFLQVSATPPICERQNEILYRFSIGCSLLAGLDVSLSSLLFTVRLGFFTYGFHICGGFLVRCIQAWGVFCSFYLEYRCDFSPLSSWRLAWAGSEGFSRGDFEMDCSRRFGVFIARHSQDMYLPPRPSTIGNKDS